MVKVTSPDEMSMDEDLLNDLIEKFEIKLRKERKGSDYYTLVITGEYPRDIYDRIERVYKDAGWKKATVKSSSENGERPGLTAMFLSME